jgi:hypothetical protein
MQPVFACYNQCGWAALLLRLEEMEAPVPAALGQLPAIPEEHAAQLRDQGFCVVKGLLSAELLAEAVRSAQSTSAQPMF